MEHQLALTTVPICLGMDFISLIFLFYRKFTHFWVRATFESLRLISWTSFMFTAWSNMSQQCFIGYRYGKYASQCKTLISWFSMNCWNFHVLYARICWAQTKTWTKVFSRIWDHFSFLQGLLQSSFDSPSLNSHSFNPMGIAHETWTDPSSWALISTINLQRICGQLLAEYGLFHQLCWVRSVTHSRRTQNYKFWKYSINLSKNVSALAGKGNGPKSWKTLQFKFFDCAKLCSGHRAWKFQQFLENQEIKIWLAY